MNSTLRVVGCFLGCGLSTLGASVAAVAAGPMQIYLLVGQSNMAGRGELEAEDREPHPRVFMLDRAGTWVPAREPMHFDNANRGTGPGFAFGRAMAEAHPGARIGLVPAAVGGTVISYWQPGHAKGLYAEAVRRAKIACQEGTLKGILWQQGESDSTATRAPLYRDRLMEVLRAFRRDLGDDTLPIVIGGLGDFLKSPEAPLVNRSLQEVANELGHAVFVPASGFGHIGDRLHFNAAAQRENGRNMARAMTSE